MGADAWQWDEWLYVGSAPYYGVGRMPYPSRLVQAVRDELGLDGTGRLLDVGCGPGSLTLLLSPLFESAVGIDADRDMIVEAHRRAVSASVGNIEWRRMRAEELPADLGIFRAVTFAQSFHWMDQDRVAQQVRGMLSADGAWVHIFATTHRGVAGDDPLLYPRPPWDHVDELVASYLGPVRRAGQQVLPTGTRSGEEEVMRKAGYRGPTRITVERVERSLTGISMRSSLRSSRCPVRRRTCSGIDLRRSRTTCVSCCGPPRGVGGSRNGPARLIS